MNTKRIYRENVYAREWDTCVTSASVRDDKSLITLEETIFFPTGGGQSCDLGAVDGARVLDVYEAEDEIYHLVQGSFSKGDRVHLSIDWDRRFDNMQRHCGEHILSGIFYRLYGGVNRGFHMGEDYMTIDISLEENPEFREVTWDMCLAAELETNRVIWQDLPVTYHHFDTREEAEGMPLRKKLAIEKDITIVTVGDPSEPADSVACCGTHPSGAGQVGMLKIYKVEPNKGMYRIYFEAGQRAYRDYEKSFDALTAIEKDLSAGSGDLMEKYRTREERHREVRDRLYNLTRAVLEWEAGDLEKGFRDTSSFTREFSHLTIDDLIDLGRSLSGKLPNLLFLVHRSSNTVLLFSDSLDCGKLVKDNVQVFNGKGGGNKNFARAIFNRSDDAELFIDAIKKLTSN